jgi:hypothetical protein
MYRPFNFFDPAFVASLSELPPQILEATYLVVAGGGGGAKDNGYVPGGGGGGGYLTATHEFEPGSSYTITIGAGGVGPFTTQTDGTNGGNSSISGVVTSNGGGASRRFSGNNGGSGGGGSSADFGTIGNGIAGQGNNGAMGANGTSQFANGGGGGGANSAANGFNAGGGRNFGSPLPSVERSRGADGSFGTTNGLQPSGAANTGNGGQGMRQGGNFTSDKAGNGGSGVAFIFYEGTPRATGGTITQNAGFTIHTFTSTGTFTVGSPSPQILDPDAAAFLLATEITDNTITSAINTLVITMKSDGLWTKMAAIYPFVGGTATTHKYNLKNPADTNAAYRISFSGGWTHSSAGGITPNGTNTSGDTFYRGSGTDNNFALSNWTTTTTMQANTPALFTFGANTSAFNSYAVIQNRTNANWYSNMGDDVQGAIFSYSNVGQTGLIVGSRTSSTSNKVYRNATLLATNTSTNTGSWPARNVHFGNPTSNIYTTMNSIFASISTGLTDTDVTNLYNAVNAFQTTLGR